jgi:hypothetical protein
MLNSKGERELAYVVLIDEIKPIEGYDRVEYARVGGWWVIVQKDQFKVGDPAIYFEIDSRVPSDRECFAFLEKRNYKIKTLRMCKVISQGLLMHAEDFGWKNAIDADGHPLIYDANDNSRFWYADGEDRFLTKELGVTYADDADNKRKANSGDKYKAMAARRPNIFRKKWARWFMRREWGRKLMFFFFGKKRDKKDGWPSWVQKTDEERVQNMPWIPDDKGKWIVTEKIDGTSTTFTMKRGKFGKNKMYVCSRNVCFDTVDKPCYYDTNVYWEMAKKYNIYDVLSKLLDRFPNAEWVTIQGETYGEGIQKRNYSLKGHEFAIFNLITSDKGRLGTQEMVYELGNICDVPCVPILDTITFDGLTVEELLELADGNSVIDGLPREGFVLRSLDGARSFKAVSNNYLLKYHQ